MKIRLGVGVLFMATVMMAQTPDAGKDAAQLQDLANHAKESGDLQSEADYLCRAAALDAKRYGKKCDRAKEDLAKALAQFHADLGMGRTELQRKDYPGALRDLGKITFGPNKAEAQSLMQQARIGIGGGTPVDPASSAAFNAAREAYLRGDFDSAQFQAKRVQSPALQTAANQLLTNISVYRDTMKQADLMIRNGDLKGAEQKYQFAVTIQQNGPGHPLERLRQLQAEEAQASITKMQPQQNVSVQSSPQGKPAQVAPKVNYAAKVKSSLEVAHRDETLGDLRGALHAYNAALELDGRQAEAAAGKMRVLGEMKEDPKDVEDHLTEGIADFYASHFSSAFDAIGMYLQGGGKQYLGAAHFYSGASLLAQALLTSPTNQPQADTLRHQAQDQFLRAKQLHYKPIESAVSPKIFAQWTQIGVGQ